METIRAPHHDDNLDGGSYQRFRSQSHHFAVINQDDHATYGL